MPRSKPAPVSTSDDHELALLRAGRHDFYGHPDFGEVRWLDPGEVPEMLVSYGEGLPTEIATWAAEEADGAAIGRLVLPDVPVAHRPIVMIDNEGTTRLTGFSWVDHFGASTMAAYRGETEVLLQFCRENELPEPRTAEEIRRLADALGLDDNELGEGRVPRVDPAALATIHDRGATKQEAADVGAAAASEPAEAPAKKKTAKKAAKAPAAKKAAKAPAAKKAAKAPAAKKAAKKAAKAPAAKKAAKAPAKKKAAKKSR